jgi:epsilon-lactone hydrolase
MSIRNRLVIAYMRWKNYKADGDELTLEERQKDNLPAPPAAVAQRAAVEMLSIDGAKAVWLDKQNSENGVLVYLHGESYIAGPFGDQWLYLADMCRRTQMAALLIDYRLAPQNPFPCGLDDVLMIIETLRAIGDLPEKWFLLGDSAGAGLAVAAVYELREMDVSLPKKMILMSGWFDVTLENPDIQKNYHQDPMLSRARLTESANSYVGGDDPKNPLISPLYGDIRILPPTLVQIGTYDMFLWENRLFHRKCLDAKIDVQYEEYPNTFHDFMMVGFLPEAGQARKSQAEFLTS